MIRICLVLVIVGVLLYLVNDTLPMDGKVKKILNVVVIVGTLFWLLSLFFPSIPTLPLK